MDKKPEKMHEDRWLKNLPAPAGDENFKPEELLDCPRCTRRNAPTRLKCIYCGAALPVTQTAHLKRLSRKLEAWENGFNIIFLPREQISDESKLGEIAKMLRLETDELRKIVEAETPLPAARAESEQEAEIISKKLRENGFDSIVLSDKKLEIETLPRRLRRIEFFADKIVFILFNTDEIVEISPENLCLTVSGALFERRIEVLQKHRRGKENKTLQTSELSADELLIDVYTQDDAIGYRISSRGFDFSCLETEKELLAGGNMKKLSKKLRAFATTAKFDDDYRRVRAELGSVWTVEEKTDSKGVQKKGFGQYNLESVTTINNLLQFARYSRLRRQLL